MRMTCASRLMSSGDLSAVRTRNVSSKTVDPSSVIVNGFRSDRCELLSMSASYESVVNELLSVRWTGILRRFDAEERSGFEDPFSDIVRWEDREVESHAMTCAAMTSAA
jgi:hypothetical protein